MFNRANRSTMVSIIIRTYNRINYLLEALQSVFNQTYKNFEVIVVDGGSTDQTKEVLIKMEEVKYIYQKKIGIAEALNIGFKHSYGDFIAFLDDDDIWLRHMLEKSIRKMEESVGEIGIIVTGFQYLQKGTQGEKVRFRNSNKSKKNLFKNLLKRNFIPINSVLIRRHCLEKVGLFDKGLKGNEDWDLWLRLHLAGVQFEFVEETLALIRIHDSNTSRDILKMKEGSVRVLEKIHFRGGLRKGEAFLIKRALAKRRISLGWYLTQFGFFEEGRKEINRAVPMNWCQRFQKILTLFIFSVSHPLIRNLFYSLAGFLTGEKRIKTVEVKK